MNSRALRKLRRQVIALSIGLATVTLAHAQDGAGQARVVRGAVTIRSVDPATRTVVVRGANGQEKSFVAGPEVKNLSQVKAGDIVNIAYRQAFAMSLVKSDKTIRERVESQNITTAEPGQRPGLAVTQRIAVVASVEAIDPASRVIKLRGPSNTVELEVEDAALLKGLKKGDFVDAVYGEAIVLDVEPPNRK